MKNLISAFAGIFGATMILTSCGGSGGGSDDSSSSGDLGPTSGQSLAGTTISFNPTVTFLPGGRLEWVNEESGTPFVQATASDPLGGTYIYDPETNYRSGFLTITLDGEQPIFVNVDDFVTVDGIVREFSMEIFGDIYPTSVVGGTLFAAEREGVEGVNDRPVTDSGFTFQENGNLTVGTTFTKVLLATSSQGDISATPLLPYTAGSPEDFEIIGDGSLLFEGANSALTLFFVSATNDGILTYQASVNGGTLTATLNTGAVEGSSDFAIVWSRSVLQDNGGQQVSVDNKVFSR